jgi:uncharacterized protein YggU (UPF0235/DUF167 family)
MDRWRYVVVTGTKDRRPGALRFSVRLTPKGGHNAIEGWRMDAGGKRVLKARVAAAPEEGRANRALVALIADALHIGTSKVRIVGGSASRMKTVEVEGESSLMAARLDRAGGKG